MAFAKTAPQYWARNLPVIPVEPGTKRPAKEIKGWPGYIGGVIATSTQDDWINRFPNHGIGLLAGGKLGDSDRLVAVDVDDDRFVTAVKDIIGNPIVAKRGKKGLTIFVRAPTGTKSRQFKTADGRVGADILSGGKMTVLPDSIHPETKEPYQWVGDSLLDVAPENLPYIDEQTLSVLGVLIASENSLKMMSGEGTHDAGVSLTAALISAGATDEQVAQTIRGVLPQDYGGNSLSELQEWIKSAREKGFGAVARLPIDEQVAQIIAKQLHPLAFVPGDGFLQYSDGHWSPVSDSEIDRLAKSLLITLRQSKSPVRPMLENVRKCLALNVERAAFGDRAGFICLRNGTLNIKTGELEQHSPDHELRSRIDIDYDPTAECPIYANHIRHVLQANKKAISLFDEFAGLTLISEMSFQKAVYLVGPAGSGKSTLLRTVAMLHDPNALSTIPLGKLEDERYLTGVVRKLVCISYDVQTRKSIFGESFVRITGGDPIATRRLYQEVQGLVVPTVRFLGSMNLDVPPSRAATDALERRLIFLSCGGKPKNIDPMLFEKLIAERPGILVRLVQALKRLLARGEFDIPDDSTALVAEYLHDQDPFETFAASQLTPDSNARTSVMDITSAYNEWGKVFGARLLSLSSVGRKLRALGFDGGIWRGADGKGVNQRYVCARLPQTSYKDC